MSQQIANFSRARLLIVGDVMLDRYWFGNTSRISPEAPVPVVRVDELKECAGGAGNVALNSAALGSQVTLMGLVGEDEVATSLAAVLNKPNISTQLLPVAEKKTITKLRVLSRHQQLIRLDFEDGFSKQEATQLEHVYSEHLKQVDAVLLSDYAKGTLANVEKLIQLAKAQNLPVIIDPKSADFSIYSGATLLTPNRKEFEQCVGPCSSGQELAEKGKLLLIRHQLQALLVTLGEDGMLLLRNNEPAIHFQAKTQEVYDVTGAGDTVIAVIASALASGQDLAKAVELSNIAAGIVVRKLGAATVSEIELQQAMQEIDSIETGIVSEASLLSLLQQVRHNGERVVMTNGCFDLLHPGHVAYLEQAKQLGHRLIVAVNSDDSVKRLKGPTRPINSLKSRMQVLAALRVVDWVVVFSEDTPARLIEAVSPDVLVKGGDYKVEEIAGAKSVLAKGGRVEILEFIANCSTSNVVKKIQQGEGVL